MDQQQRIDCPDKITDRAHRTGLRCFNQHSFACRGQPANLTPMFRAHQLHQWRGDNFLAKNHGHAVEHLLYRGYSVFNFFQLFLE